MCRSRQAASTVGRMLAARVDGTFCICDHGTKWVLRIPTVPLAKERAERASALSTASTSLDRKSTASSLIGQLEYHMQALCFRDTEMCAHCLQLAHRAMHHAVARSQLRALAIESSHRPRSPS